MAERHPDVDLIAHLRGELGGADHARVETHLAGCAECRRARATFDAIVAALRRAQPPAVDWGRWHAELRGRLEADRARRWWWPRHPVRIVLPAAAAAALIALALPFGRALVERAPAPDVVAFDEVVLGSRLGLLQHYEVVQRLDLLEDLDVIAHLDRLQTPREG
jgi:anti-sigma factor RsiW